MTEELSPFKVVSLDSWNAFREAIARYVALPVDRRTQFIFRGQAKSEWRLVPTLDRGRAFADRIARERMMTALLREFKQDALNLDVDLPTGSDETDWELLGRHHGLATPILDWTRSPYIAAFFAFDDVQAAHAEHVSVWALDREAFLAHEIPEVEVIDSQAAIRLNPRAVEQRSVFLRISAASQSADEILAQSLYRFDIPAIERDLALGDLDEMNINARILFRDLDGVARLSMRRVLGN